MYQFGLDCLETKRFDTGAPGKLISILMEIDDDLGGQGDIWRKEGVYDNAKQALEGMEEEAARQGAAKADLLIWTRRVRFLAASQARQYDDARVALDKIGDKLRTDLFSRFLMRYPYDVARIYALTAKDGKDAGAFDALIATNGHREPGGMKSARELLDKAAAKNSDPKAKPYFDYWKTCLLWQEQFDGGKWVDLTFDKGLSMWEPILGGWAAVGERAVRGAAKGNKEQQRMKCVVPFGMPFEVECDLDVPDLEAGSFAGFMVGEVWSRLSRDNGALFVACNKQKLALVASSGAQKEHRIHLANPHKCHLRLRYWNPYFEFFADGQLYVGCALPKLPPHDSIGLAFWRGDAQFRNLRIRKVNYDPPPAEDGYVERLAYFEDAVGRDPQDAYAYLERGTAQKGLNHYDKAVADCKKAAELAPSWALPYYVIYETEYQREGWAEILDALNKYTKLVDDNPSVFMMKARIQATARDERLRDGKVAIENAKKACDIAGYRQFPGVETLAAAYAEVGNFDEAVSWAGKALELAPEENKKECRERIELYRSRKPFRMKPSTQDKEKNKPGKKDK
jgi:tetratricopeptide (TPR) repeat protein